MSFGCAPTGCIGAGNYLSSQGAAPQVFSAQVSLTSVFGMGTGGTSPSSSPAIGVMQYLRITSQSNRTDRIVRFYQFKSSDLEFTPSKSNNELRINVRCEPIFDH